MSNSGVMALAHRLFPHRQFYLRSRGSVQFFEFSPRFQMGTAIGTVAVMLWVAYASIVVIFKEQIITAKDQRYASMQAAYEGRVSQMQLAYDELNGLLVLAEERFQNATRDLEQKHRQLTALLMQKQAMDKQVREVKSQMAHMQDYTGRSYAQAAARNGSNTLMMQMASAEPSVRQGRTAQGDTESSIGVVAASLVDRASEEGSENTAAAGKNSVVKRIADLEERLTDIQKQQVALLGELRDSAGSQIEKYQRVVAMTGLNADDVADQVGMKSKNGVGGPLLLAPELRAAAINGAGDEFEKQFAEIAQAYGKLDSLTTALSRLPLVTPIATGSYRSTSGFGYRVDPFTGRFAFHAGADMAGDSGTAILASAPGRVMAAEYRGPYGNMVEIDHGRGIRTRYGHLKSILVKVGDLVHFRQKIATMGSSGRSTGPHLHYEIWFNNVVRDPTKFFDAGRNVYKG
jgi:murein DD-endopeptidase MepM/ murein hydrolase activator NlpD